MPKSALSPMEAKLVVVVGPEEKIGLNKNARKEQRIHLSNAPGGSTG